MPFPANACCAANTRPRYPRLRPASRRVRWINTNLRKPSPDHQKTVSETLADLSILVAADADTDNRKLYADVARVLALHQKAAYRH